MSVEPGKMFGPYEVLDVVGSSKTETAYRVRNSEEGGRFEILHVLPKSKQEDLQEVERFLRETRVHSRLLHPNILSFYRAAEVERRLIFTTEYVEGVPLSERLKLGPLPWQEAAAFVQQALLALGYAHAQGMIHRDVTPANMIITEKGMVKLSNFALAKFTNSPQLTQFGAVVGALEYIAPEQIKGTEALDGRCDLYSLGVVLYEALTGKPPFASKSQFELMLAHVSEAPKPPTAMKPDLPGALDAAVLKALAKDPAARYRDAEEFRAALSAVAAAAPAAAPAHPPAEPLPEAPAEQKAAAAAASSSGTTVAAPQEPAAPARPAAAAVEPPPGVPQRTPAVPPAEGPPSETQQGGALGRDLVLAGLAGVIIAAVVIVIYLLVASGR